MTIRIWHILVILSLSISCANQLLKQSPKLAPEETHYDLDPAVPGLAYTYTCRKLEGKDRDCKRDYQKDIIGEWSFFAPHFILIPRKLVYP